MITPLLIIHCLLWLIPCFPSYQAAPTGGQFISEDQVEDPHMFPQYQLVQIIARDPQSLSDLESQLKSQASGENEREEQVWMETDEDVRKYPEFSKKDQETILYPDDTFFEEYPVISFRKTPLLQTRRTETTLDKAGQKEILSEA